MFGITRKTALAGITGLLCTGLLGSAAFAAFAPAPTPSFSIDANTGAVTMSEAPKADGLKTILDGLVAKGVITQAQEDAIVAAVKEAHGQDSVLRTVVAGLLHESASYLGFNEKELRARLPDTSLGALADKTNGKSRGGLIADLTTFADNAVDKLLADGKITQGQADKVKAAIPIRVTQFADRVWPKAKPRPGTGIHGVMGGLAKDARAYLGLSHQDIAGQLRAGKSLGDIANATAGKSRQGLVDTLVADANAKIDQAVKQGSLTQAQAEQLRSKVADAVAKLVDHRAAPKASR